MKVKLGLDSLTFDELADLLDNVHAAMVTNAATFNAPNPTMAALAALSTALRAAIAARRRPIPQPRRRCRTWWRQRWRRAPV